MEIQPRENGFAACSNAPQVGGGGRLRRFALPDGLDVFAANELELLALHREIFEQRTYDRHGISVPDGGCVFDVGANVGLYSIYLSRGRPGLRIFAFEPIPRIYEMLEANARLHALGPRATLLRLALSDRAGSARFAYDRFASVTATMYPDYLARSVRRGSGARDWARAAFLDLPRIGRLSPESSRRLLSALERPVLGPLVTASMHALLLFAEARKRLFLQRPSCRLDTLSNVIAEHGVGAIDLVKIDVEGAELDVLRGIGDADWRRIRQLVVEVHDIDGRVAAMQALLEGRGYRTTVDQEDWELHKLINTYTLYAVRR